MWFGGERTNREYKSGVSSVNDQNPVLTVLCVPYSLDSGLPSPPMAGMLPKGLLPTLNSHGGAEQPRAALESLGGLGTYRECKTALPPLELRPSPSSLLLSSKELSNTKVHEP